MGEKS